jgi:hypothetical protein
MAALNVVSGRCLYSSTNLRSSFSKPVREDLEMKHILGGTHIDTPMFHLSRLEKTTTTAMLRIAVFDQLRTSSVELDSRHI